MELQASRAAARRGPNGEAVLLPEQDRSLWDYEQIQRGMVALDCGQKLGGGANSYTLQARLQRVTREPTPQQRPTGSGIVLLYDALLRSAPLRSWRSNRAVAVGMAQGPAAGLDALDALALSLRWPNYHLLPSVRGDLLVKLGRYAEARKELQRALAMTENRREQDLLTAKLNQTPLNDRFESMKDLILKIRRGRRKSLDPL